LENLDLIFPKDQVNSIDNLTIKCKLLVSSGPQKEGAMSELDAHYTIVTKHLVDGNVVPFLGAGANLCGRPRDTPWRQGQYLPSGRELASFLAESYAYPARHVKLACPKCQAEVQAADEALDLLRVSQYVAAVAGGSGDLYRELHQVFDADYPTTSVHRFLATLPAALAHKGYPDRQLLVVTTNYDDLMERAFREAGQPFDTLTYKASGEYRGRFFHTPPEGEARLIEDPNKYTEVSSEQRPVVLKIHGAVSRGRDWEKDSYVIREDDYIEYLACTTEINSVLPATIGSKLKVSHLLFLGYSLSDWNLRVILYRIWTQLKFSYKSWAIQVRPQKIDQDFWANRNVDILDVSLDEYVKALTTKIGNLAEGTGQPPLSVR
jgi:SIR2-like domain